MKFEKTPDHPIIDKPWEYDIVGFNYQVDPDNWRNSYIDVTLKKNDSIRQFCFISPQNVKIEVGFLLTRTGGMEILDVSDRQLDGIKVWVNDFEASPGAITFWAYQVIDLDKLEPE